MGADKKAFSINIHQEEPVKRRRASSNKFLYFANILGLNKTNYADSKCVFFL